MIPMIYASVAALIISMASLAGIIFYNSDIRLVHFLMSFAAGTMLSASFLHLLPESMESMSYDIAAYSLLVGIVAMFLVEKSINWHHCHSHSHGKSRKTAGKMVLVGDSIHNFLDGIALYSSFNLSVETGMAVALSILLHEIPQELGDFGILIHSGFSRSRALLYNFISALSALLGVFMASSIESYAPLMAAFSAGGLLYIAMSDIIPEMHKEGKAWIAYHLSGLALGIMAIMLL